MCFTEKFVCSKKLTSLPEHSKSLYNMSEWWEQLWLGAQCLALHAELPDGAHSYGSHQPLRDLAIMATDLPLHSSGLSLTGAPLGTLNHLL